MTSKSRLQEQQEAFAKSLGEFERCVDTPFIPGELSPWMDDVANAFDRLKRKLEAQTRHVHASELHEIVCEDPELLQRVEMMRTEDRQIAEQADRLSEIVAACKIEVRQVGADEAVLREELNALVVTAQQFIARVRKQEVTLRTWWMEAMMRDRGVVD